MPSAEEIIDEYISKFPRQREHLRNLRRMIARVKNVDVDQIIFYGGNVHLDERETAILAEMLERYEKNEPLSKIINIRSFWNHEFFVNGNVLDPRPETELIVEMVLAQFDRGSSLNFLDVGTGSGCLLLSLLGEYKNSRGIGLDISATAIQIAKHNGEKLGVVRANFILADWNNFNAMEKFDVVVSNPPYVKTNDIPLLEENVKNYDPPIALDGGISGLDAYISLAPLAGKWLKPNGSVFFEVGYNQAESVARILQNSGFRINAIKKDTAGMDRAVWATLD